MFEQHHGVVLVATGRRYKELLLQALKTLKSVEERTPVVAFLDENLYREARDELSALEVKAEVIANPTFSYFDKLTALLESPFERTIFIDADTYCVRPFVKDLLHGLDFFPVIALPGMSLNHRWEIEEYGASHSQWNTGVIAIDNNRCQGFLQRWLDIYRGETAPGHDQPSFRAALLETGTNCGPLAPEFNFMGHGYVKEPRILHFTAQRRLQRWYQNHSSRARLVERFSANGYEGFFSDFFEVGSHGSIRGRSAGAAFSWWLKGAGLWVWVRVVRYVLGAYRRTIRPVIRRLIIKNL